MSHYPDRPNSDRPCNRASSTARILIVEDNYIIAANLQEKLVSLGYGISDIAHSVEEALKKAVQLHPDLVLMDIRLEGELDGIQAADWLWKQLWIPVIYITAHSDTETFERAKATAPFGYLLKPVKNPSLYIAIETALERSKQ